MRRTEGWKFRDCVHSRILGCSILMSNQCWKTAIGVAGVMESCWCLAIEVERISESCGNASRIKLGTVHIAASAFIRIKNRHFETEHSFNAIDCFVISFLIFAFLSNRFSVPLTYRNTDIQQAAIITKRKVQVQQCNHNRIS